MYSYAEHKPWVLTDEGQRAFLKFRDRAKLALEETGAFTLGCGMNWCSGVGDSWNRIALVDRLVELGEIVKLERPGYASQDQVYAKP